MKISRFVIPALLGLMCFSATCRSAQAALITYTDRTVFNSNSTGRTDIAFETAPTNSLTYYGSTVTFSGVTFSGGALYTVDSGIGPVFDYNSGDSLYQDVISSFTTVTLPGNITAVGLDYMSQLNGNQGQTAGYEFVINGQTYTGTSLGRPNRAFFGFTSDTAITSFTYRATGSNVTADRSLIDNFSFGTSTVVATPEPSTYAMMALGCIALCVLGARRKKDGQAA